MGTDISSWDNHLDPIVIVTEAVRQGRQPVARVLHEEGHGGWQMYDDVEPLGKPVVVPKDEILSLDPSLADIIDLPVGWQAMREGASSQWRTAPV